MLVLSFSFLLQLANGMTLLVVLLLPSFGACLVYFVLCVWAMLQSQVEKGEESGSAAAQLQMNVSLSQAGGCALSFPSHSTASDMVLSVCLLIFFVEHRKYNSKPKLSFEQSSSLHYT